MAVKSSIDERNLNSTRNSHLCDIYSRKKEFKKRVKDMNFVDIKITNIEALKIVLVSHE